MTWEGGSFILDILVVDDDENIRKLISDFLFQTGYKIVQAKNGIDALNKLEMSHFDLIILDIMMPYMDGFELTQDIRSINKNMPILMITAKEDFESKRIGFNAGADDYMSKPIDLEELSLRITALLRRAKINTNQKIELNEVILDSDSLKVIIKNETIELPKKEFYLLFKLLSYPDKIFTRRQLMDEIWGMDSEADERTVDVHIKRLREKFDENNNFKIVTIRGLGYKTELIS